MTFSAQIGCLLSLAKKTPADVMKIHTEHSAWSDDQTPHPSQCILMGNTEINVIYYTKWMVSTPLNGKDMQWSKILWAISALLSNITWKSDGSKYITIHFNCILIRFFDQCYYVKWINHKNKSIEYLKYQSIKLCKPILADLSWWLN